MVARAIVNAPYFEDFLNPEQAPPLQIRLKDTLKPSQHSRQLIKPF